MEVRWQWCRVNTGDLRNVCGLSAETSWGSVNFPKRGQMVNPSILSTVSPPLSVDIDRLMKEASKGWKAATDGVYLAEGGGRAPGSRR